MNFTQDTLTAADVTFGDIIVLGSADAEVDFAGMMDDGFVLITYRVGGSQKFEYVCEPAKAFSRLGRVC